MSEDTENIEEVVSSPNHRFHHPITAFRRKNLVTMREIARATGVHISTIREIENGKDYFRLMQSCRRSIPVLYEELLEFEKLMSVLDMEKLPGKRKITNSMHRASFVAARNDMAPMSFIQMKAMAKILRRIEANKALYLTEFITRGDTRTLKTFLDNGYIEKVHNRNFYFSRSKGRMRLAAEYYFYREDPILTGRVLPLIIMNK